MNVSNLVLKYFNTTMNDSENLENINYNMSLYIYIWVTFTNVVIFLAGVFGNVMVILVVLKVKQMKTHMNYLLLNLSFADLLVLIICQPSALLEFYAKDRWYLGLVMCEYLIPQLENAVVHASVFTILVITIERHNAICFPLKKTCFAFTEKRTTKCIALIWILAYISTCPFMVMAQEQDTEFYDGTPCKICRTVVEELWQQVMYIRIIRCLVSETISVLSKRDNRLMSTLRSRKQVVRMIIGIMILFFITVFPMRIVSLWIVYAPPSAIIQLGVDGYINLLSFARAMVYINSAGNPIIYSLTSTKFKRAFSKLL
ncbi:hypothetical protein KUTeg_005004, partial [Tegillarca granosa]